MKHIQMGNNDLREIDIKKVRINKMKMCEICGNEIDENAFECPYCGHNNKKQNRNIGKRKYLTVNIKLDMPTCVQAIAKVGSIIHKAHYEGIKVLKIIHGYGSTGKGGELRYCLRDHFSNLQYQHAIKYYIEGEKFNRNYPNGKKVLSSFRFLYDDSDYNRNNRGITLIVL